MKRNNFLNIAKAKEEAEAKAAADKVAKEKSIIRKKFFVNNIGTNIDFDFNDTTTSGFNYTNKYFITNDTSAGTTSSTQTGNTINNFTSWDIE